MKSLCVPMVVLLSSWIAGCTGDDASRASGDSLTPMLRRHGETIEVPAGSPLRGRIAIQTITPQEIPRTFEAPAQIDADPSHLVRVTPPVPGRVVNLFVHFGDHVTRDQPLLTLDSADMVGAQTDYLQARSALAQAERTLSRQEDLVSHGIGAQRDLEVAQTERQVAEQELERSLERLRLYGLSAGRIGRPLTLRSPIEGRVVDFQVATGEFHADPGDVLMTIADIDTVWVTAQVQEKDIRRVTADEPVTVTLPAYPNEHWTGTVEFVGEILDPDTRTLQVRVALANEDHRLHPGMFATVQFAETSERVMLVPTTAVVLMGDASYVFVESASWRFERRRVQVGESIDTRSIVESGLHPGDRVVTANAVLLQ